MAGGHITKAPATIIYYSVVLRKRVRIALMVTTLNDLKVKLGYILNTYVQASMTEKVWTILCPEFGKDASKTAVIIRASYGLKLAGAALRIHFTRCMESTGCESCEANLDL